MAESGIPDIQIDADNLYREETFTDLTTGTIRLLVPVTRTGEDDPDRDVRYEGSASLMTPAGNLPLQFDLGASSLAEAIDNYAEAASAEAERAIEELKQLQREQSQKIQVPGQGGAGGQGGGQIQL
ncbi:hypothetical protein HKX42_02730 [Salinisphaera sp. USBA-960]|uniref:hypothetical protein n=1 Tax=Salinisphaera orenii TaxID=856731 RepID=UPI000DBE2B67|nr:hypothetical protein [Salifodinibacter halophilus]NNC25791.1 hypothetical protein [Salifodinibacter halophilus]